VDFGNELIKNYFEGDDSYVPTSELMYLHTRPLVQPNFLAQLEEMVLETGKLLLVKHNIKGYPLPQLETLAIKIGQRLPTITQDNAPEILGAMREVYRICKEMKTTLK
jgi:hypothetical protein